VQRRSLATLVVMSFTLLFVALAGVAEAQAQQTQYEDTPAQDTTRDTTIDDTIDQTARDAQNDTNRSNSDSFQCVQFLRVVRDDQGALRAQYRDDELIVQRYEQCLSGDVLADTIPNKLLPDTGGVPLLGLAAISLASVIAGASVLRAATRRRR
jgi:hypothetical protein